MMGRGRGVMVKRSKKGRGRAKVVRISNSRVIWNALVSGRTERKGSNEPRFVIVSVKVNASGFHNEQNG